MSDPFEYQTGNELCCALFNETIVLNEFAQRYLLMRAITLLFLKWNIFRVHFQIFVDMHMFQRLRRYVAHFL